MKFFVQMFAFQPEFCRRPVDVPQETYLNYGIRNLLDQIYHFGQNEIQPVEGICSVSTGDVIEIPMGDTIDFYLVQTLGFEKLTQQEYNNYRSLNREDRFWFAFKKKTE